MLAALQEEGKKSGANAARGRKERLKIRYGTHVVAVRDLHAADPAFLQRRSCWHLMCAQQLIRVHSRSSAWLKRVSLLCLTRTLLTLNCNAPSMTSGQVGESACHMRCSLGPEQHSFRSGTALQVLVSKQGASALTSTSGHGARPQQCQQMHIICTKYAEAIGTNAYHSVLTIEQLWQRDFCRASSSFCA